MPTSHPWRDLHAGAGIQDARCKWDHDHVVRHGPEVVEADAGERLLTQINGHLRTAPARWRLLTGRLNPTWTGPADASRITPTQVQPTELTRERPVMPHPGPTREG